MFLFIILLQRTSQSLLPPRQSLEYLVSRLFNCFYSSSKHAKAYLLHILQVNDCLIGGEEILWKS